MSVNTVAFLVIGIFSSLFVDSAVDAATNEATSRFEPQVAIACGSRYQYYSQYMSESGKWKTDSTSKVTCLKEKAEILEYCKQVYPDREITNIVDASHYYKVPNFCRAGRSKCKTSIWVKPYRCLEGSFQSDALLVPEGCLFDHIHNQSKCWEFDRWNSTADQACQRKAMTLKAFAMLLPCGIDVFSGVEFVCCPRNYRTRTNSHNMDDVEEPLALPNVDRRAPATSTQAPSSTAKQEIGARDEYFSRFDPHEEHDAFRRAEQRLEDRHRDKVAKIMKEWSDLNNRYQDLRLKDQRGAEEFKQRMTQQFQHTVQSLEARNEAEKHQLTTLHQQRIVAHINEIKREAMTCYTHSLNLDQPNTRKVQKCLQKLLRALNKDRHHTVAHYKHLLHSDYEMADKERDSTLQHLADLDKMVNQSLNMLAKHPDLFVKIGNLMQEYATALRSKDATPPELTPKTPTEDETELEDSDDYSDEDDEDDEDDDEDDSGEEDDVEIDDDEDDDSIKKDDDEFEKVKRLPTVTETHEEPAAKDSTSSEHLPIDNEIPASAPIHRVVEPKVAHARQNILSHRSSFSVTATDKRESRGVYFAIAFAGVALMGAVVVGMFILRRRNGNHPHNQGFMEVDQAITPEERHVANMQVNGYENPTYKYFEK